jgi:hypothetical protein
VIGAIDERTGTDGQPRRDQVSSRLPMGQAWNGRLVFSGDGDSNGSLGDALSVNGTGTTPLAGGWANL